MNAVNKDKTPDNNLKNTFDILCQEFDGKNFYGLEYILEDFFQSTTIKSSGLTRSSIDWFGLYS